MIETTYKIGGIFSVSGSPDREPSRRFGRVWPHTSAMGRLSINREQDDDNDGSKSGEFSFLPFKHHGTHCVEPVHFGRRLEP